MHTTMRLGGIEHLSGLYEAARNSAVPLRKTLLPREAIETAIVVYRPQWIMVPDGDPPDEV